MKNKASLYKWQDPESKLEEMDVLLRITKYDTLHKAETQWCSKPEWSTAMEMLSKIVGKDKGVW